MEYHILGKSGVEVSPLCLGCLNIGAQGWREWVLDKKTAESIIKKAIDLGINFFDTAGSYSNGESEVFLGNCLKKFGNLNEIVISTKVFVPNREGPNMGGLSRKHIQQACEESLKRLGVDCIDLYNIHRLDPYTSLEETVRALENLIQQGKIRYVGASSMYAWQFMKALDIQKALGASRFIAMQNHYNLIYREEEREMIPLCEDQHIAVNPWSPLARGLLAHHFSDDKFSKRAQYDQSRTTMYSHSSDKSIIDAVSIVAESKGCSMAQVALAWLHAKPYVCSPVVGVSSTEQLVDAVASLSFNLDYDEINRLEAAYEPHAVSGLPVTPKRFPFSC